MFPHPVHKFLFVSCTRAPASCAARGSPTGSWSLSGTSPRSRPCDPHVPAPHGMGEGAAALLSWEGAPQRTSRSSDAGGTFLLKLRSKLYFVSGWSFCLLSALGDHMKLTCYSDRLAPVYHFECCPPNFIPVLEPVENITK